MMKNRPFVLLVAMFATLPLVLDEMPSPGEMLRGLDVMTGGAWPMVAVALLMLGGAIIAWQQRRSDVEA